MITPQQKAALIRVYTAACAAGVPFPDAQACEVMVESTWGTSALFLQDLNGFGMKQHQHPRFGTVNFPTREYLGGRWQVVNAAFVKYPSLEACFQDRMATLTAMAPQYPHYAAALAAKTPEEFLTQVSLTWSTGPSRGQQCVEILHAHQDVFHPQVVASVPTAEPTPAS